MVRGLCLGLLAAFPTAALGQQVADSTFVPDVETPSYPAGTGPVVAVDAAHHNFHTIRDRYRPFAAILEADGYRVVENLAPFASGSLDSCAVLVIANAGTDESSSWSLPTPSALTDAEIDAVVDWVSSGGSLFLIADHMPAAGAVAPLAARFGVQLTNGYTFQERLQGLPGDRFSRADGTLYDHPITRGRSAAESIDAVVSFTGQGFQATAPVDTLLRFGPGAISLLPVEAGVGFAAETPRVFSGGWLHGVALRSGAGRVVIFGEAAMFSAQRAGPEGRPMGLNRPEAGRNQQLLLNILHWLTGALD